MVLMILWALLGMLVLFLLLVFSREALQKKFKIKICAICSTVSLTWITLLVLKLFLGVKEIDNLFVGILMGGSLVGIMYLFEKKAKEAGKGRLLWIKFLIILFGVYLIYLFLSEVYNLVFWLVLLASVILLIYIVVSIKGEEKEGSGKSKGRKNGDWNIGKKHSKLNKEIKKLEEKFEHCCD